jgi:hypothetical protein
MLLALKQFFKRSPWAGWVLKLLPIAAALWFALIPLPASTVESFYANGVYAWLQAWLTEWSNETSSAVGDVLLILVGLVLPLWWAVRLLLGRGRRRRVLARLAFRSLILTAWLYLAFLFLWGFNYMREPLTAKLDYDEQRLTEEAKRAFTLSAIARLNSDSQVVRSSAWPVEDEWREKLFESFEATVTAVGNEQGIVEPLPKTSLFDWYFGATGISGFTNPFGLEVILNSELLPVERPFTLAHEWAHVAGFGDESEANFIALLACARSEVAAVRYSGWLALVNDLPIPQAELERLRSGAKWEEVLPPIAAEVKADLEAVRERYRKRLNPTITRVQKRAYDQFLKANRVEEGIASYGLFVRLLLGARFEREWTPALREGF